LRKAKEERLLDRNVARTEEIEAKGQDWTIAVLVEGAKRWGQLEEQSGQWEESCMSNQVSWGKTPLSLEDQSEVFKFHSSKKESEPT